jgi:hypothetical protein
MENHHFKQGYVNHLLMAIFYGCDRLQQGNFGAPYAEIYIRQEIGCIPNLQL